MNSGSLLQKQDASKRPSYVLALDTANEVIALGLGVLHQDRSSVQVIHSASIEARRASNTRLLPCIDELLSQAGIERSHIDCVVVGRGPGSFTGVRIAMATAKGMASALGTSLIGVSSLDAVAWNVQHAGLRGDLAVVADAMRKEVYPVRYRVFEHGIERLDPDRVTKVDGAAHEFVLEAGDSRWLAGDGLYKYAEAFISCGSLTEESLWAPTGEGLLFALQQAWQAEEVDPFDTVRHNPALVLPVYTRLSDAEENERIRLAKNDPKNLVTGVQENALRRDQRASMNDSSVLNAKADSQGIVYKPLDAAHSEEVAELECCVMGSDAWTSVLIADELPRSDRTWWAAYFDEELIGYAGGWIIDGQLQILKVGVNPLWRRCGIARALLARIASDARDLGATSCSLEVRASNAGAISFYNALGLASLGIRPRYYSDREDAYILEGPLPVAAHDVAGMTLQVDEARACAACPAQGGIESNPFARPLILAIESSCDETAAAIVDGKGNLVSDVVASQIDFHARFGGVVPEIASRKHIEALCGVCDECLDVAAVHLGLPSLSWSDLDAVCATHTPGLVGALVVGVAFAKGAAWAIDKPFIGVHHLEGHLYANKIGVPDFAPPAVVSLVSGGNTLLVHMKDWGEYETLGSTIDDAVGEAFDKVAKALGLGYPGGPAVSKQAAQGRADAILFPRAMLHSGDLRFSLSGLKTAVVSYINKEREAGRELCIPDICASFQQAVVDVQVKKAESALKQTGAATFCLGGGVAANPVLRQAYESLCEQLGVRLVMPPLSACGDNAGMIALVAQDRYQQGKFFGLDADALARADLDEPY